MFSKFLQAIFSRMYGINYKLKCIKYTHHQRSNIPRSMAIHIFMWFDISQQMIIEFHRKYNLQCHSIFIVYINCWLIFSFHSISFEGKLFKKIMMRKPWLSRISNNMTISLKWFSLIRKFGSRNVSRLYSISRNNMQIKVQ